MKVVHWIDKYLEEVLGIIFLAAMTFCIAWQIVARFMGVPLAWSEEAARYLFIWLIYISASYCVKNRTHIKVEIMSLFLKERGNFVLSIIADICFLFFAAVVARYGWPYVCKMAFLYQQKSPSLQINMAIPYFSFVIGYTLMVIRVIQDIFLRVKEYRELCDGIQERGKTY